jgi:hypothetical protein
MERELKFRIVLQKPPAGVDFGLQKGRGRDYETIQKQRSENSDLVFEFAVGVRAGGKGAVPTLVGPLVQGPPNARFVYLDIGTYAGQTGTAWSRRLKVPLTGIASSMINKAADDSRIVFEVYVAGTGRDGGPNCGTVKPSDGWKVVRSPRMY